MNSYIDEKTLGKLTQSIAKETAKRYERDFAALARSYKGKPVAVIKPRIAAIFKKHGGSVSNKELAQYAQMVSEGVNIHFRA
ncbi:hypothetical protein ACUY3K_06155 [Corynebacterium uberis]|uniref:hypothetical protein n=1 Tax=Corynebacterium TaxID=1716 RepID=UPI001D0A7210|nr:MULTISPECIES: hypothetical protein [Corynebacterium]MCZ9309751.1 hypothetical protein [Corynebacterium sp. c6VSa_13]UDL73554.1 hypothetical protein LH391_10830 [Corynebacterium uberis]UDL75566.1 hypothetical protein LH393_10095 [Corynebacterium uberis]UDL77779.1 hypothetical protein LH394_10080 [Corynebacterium uberis]UDL80062.1 hypothetical protein LH392_10500 [Corynebacterium uberis]